MSASAYDELARDRLSLLLDDSEELATCLSGLTSLLVRVMDERNVSPEAIRFGAVHLDAWGLAVVRFQVGHTVRAKLPFRASWNAERASDWVHGSNAVEAQFIRRCPSWRAAIVQTYDKSFRLGRDTGVPFRSLYFSVGRVHPTLERVWLRVCKSPLEKAAAAIYDQK